MKSKFKQTTAWLLTLAMIFTMLPSFTFTAWAADNDNLCEHHTEHTADCGYVEGVSDCAYHCDVCLGHDHEDEVPEEDTDFPPVCTCETDDPAIHAVGCAVYVAPETPECTCVEKCTEPNLWCDICGFDGTACEGGADEGVPYAEYELWVGGERVTSDNASDVFGDGTVSFTPAEGETPATLTLNNYTYEGQAVAGSYFAAIGYFGDDTLTLVLNGENSVTQTSSTSDSHGVYVEGDLSIEGTDSSLTVKAGTSEAGSYGVDVTGDIRISDACRLTAIGDAGYGSYGVSADGDITVSGTSSLIATGGTASGQSTGVYAGGSITVSDGGSLTAIGNTADGDSSSSYGVFSYGGGTVTLNGGTVEAEGDNGAFDVTPSYSTETHAVYDADGEVIDSPDWANLTYAKIAPAPSCDSSGHTDKEGVDGGYYDYICDNCGVALYTIWISGKQLAADYTEDEGWSYDHSTATLTLNNANITAADVYNRYSSAEICAGIHATGISSLNIKLIGTNTITEGTGTGNTSQAAGIHSHGSLTISGGTLYVTAGNANLGSYGIMTEGQSITITDATVITKGSKDNTQSWGISGNPVIISGNSHVIAEGSFYSGNCTVADGTVYYTRTSEDGTFTQGDRLDLVYPYREIITAAHLGDYTQNGDTHSLACPTDCEEAATVVDGEACSGGTATCTEKAICTVCGKSYGDEPKGHIFDADGKCACGLQAYNLYVGGVRVTSDNKDNITGTTGTATYDPATNTLTLNNYTYVGEGYVWSNEYYLDETYGAVIYYGGSDTLKLELIGESHITHQSDVFRFETYGIYSIGGIEVFGEGSLTANGGEIKTDEDDRKSDSSGVVCHGDLTVNSGSLTATTNRGYSVSCNKNITVNGGSLTATTTATTSGNGNCVGCFGNLTVNGGSLTATATRGYSVACSKNITVNGGSLTAIAEGYSSVQCNDNIAFNGGEVLVKGAPVFTSGYNGFSCENGYYRNAENGVFSLWTENSSDERPPYFAFVGADHVTTAHDNGKHTISCKNADCLLNLSKAETDCTMVYTASGSTITAACSANCGYEETAAITAEDTDYTGSDYTGATVAYSDNWTGDRSLAITYAVKDGDTLTAAPKDAGTYTASISLGEGENAVTASVDFTIAPKTLTGTVTVTPASLPYTGDMHSNPEVTVDGLTADDYEVSFPAGMINSGEYTITIVGKGNYTGQTSGTYTITKVDSSITKAPEAISGLKFKEENGNEVQQSLVTAGVAEGGTMVYRLSSDGEWSKDIPSAGQVRDYTVFYKVLGDSNHNDSAEGSVSVSIAKADAPNVTIPAQEYFYTIPTTGNSIDIKSLLPKLCAIIDGESVVAGTTGNFIENAAFNNGVLSYDTKTGTLGATGTITVKIGMRNYENVTVTVDVELIDLNPVSNSGTNAEIKYDGNTYNVAQMFTKDTNAGEASYEIIGGSGIGELKGSVLEITKAGTIEIKMTTAANGNYAAGEATATLTVNKADGTGTVSMDGWTYGETAKTPTTENGTGAAATFLYTGTGNGYSSAEVPTDAGEYTVIATFAENDLYEATTATDTFVIEQKELTPSISGSVSKVYDGTTTVPAGLSITLDGKVGNDDVSATASYAYDGVNVGTTKINATGITLSGETAKNYTLSSTTASAEVGTISKAKATITVDTADIVVTYGETVDLPEATTNFGTVACDKTAANLVNAGNYTVTYTVEGTDNYDGDTKSVTVTVNAKAITEADVELVGTLTYNGNEQIQQVNPKNGITCDVTGNTATEADTYTLTITGNGNYTGEVKLSYTVAKKPISVVWENTNLVYTGSAQSPVAKLAGVVTGDDVQAVVSGSGTNAGTYDATVSLSGEDADNYALTGSTKFTIARAPVTFKVSNNSVEEGKNISVAVTSDPANVSHTVTYRQNGSVVTPSAVGEYEIFVEITDSNYRHSASANGDAIEIGVLTIYEGKKPATYTLSYAPGEGSGTMAAEEAALAGTIRILPECIFTAPKDSNNNDMLFVGWSDGNATYKTGEQYRQPEKNVTMTALWVAEEHDISGMVKQFVSLDSTELVNRSGVVVTLMLGSKQVAQAVTDANGSYKFEHCLLGTYNLVAEYEGIRQTAKAVLGHSDMSDLEIDLPAGKTNSTVDVEPGTPDVVVGGLDEMMKDTDDTVFTEADKKVVEEGGEVEIKMEVKENPAPEKKDDLEKKAEEISTVTEIGIFIDLDLTKTVTDKDGNTVGEENKVIEEASKLLENIIFLPGHLQNKNVYHVFRDHGGKIEEMTELRSVPTGNTEGFIVDRVNHTITIYSLKYSTYAIAYTDPFTVTFNANGGKVDVESAITGTDGTLESLPTPTRSGYTFKGWFTAENGGTEVTTDTVFNADKIIYAQWTMNYVPVPSGGSTNKVTVSTAVNGKVSADLSNAKEGTTVTITVEPDDGYELDELVVSDASGNELKVTARGNNKYSFVMPDSKVSIKATFVTESEECTGGDNCLSAQFSDLDPSLWYHKATDFVLGKGLMNGVGSGKFDPNGTTSRAMIVTILWRLEGEPVVNYLMQFEDVAAESWYTEAVRWAASEGIVTGYSDAAFGPNDPITREQLATILYRYEQYKGGGFTGAWMFLLDYTDRDKVSDWAYEAMCWTTMHGVINGKGDGILDPKGNAKRCEAAQMLMNYLNK